MLALLLGFYRQRSLFKPGLSLGLELRAKWMPAAVRLARQEMVPGATNHAADGADTGLLVAAHQLLLGWDVHVIMQAVHGLLRQHRHPDQSASVTLLNRPISTGSAPAAAAGARMTSHPFD